jgi:hypothetical protein
MDVVIIDWDAIKAGADLEEYPIMATPREAKEVYDAAADLAEASRKDIEEFEKGR